MRERHDASMAAMDASRADLDVARADLKVARAELKASRAGFNDAKVEWVTSDARIARLETKVAARDEASLSLYRFNTLLDFMKKIDLVLKLSQHQANDDVKDKNDKDHSGNRYEQLAGTLTLQQMKDAFMKDIGTNKGASRHKETLKHL